MNKIKKPRKNKFSIIFIFIFAIALIAQYWVFTPFAQAAVNTDQGWEGDYNWSGKNIVLTTANGSITFSIDSTNGNDVNFSAKKWLDSVWQNRLGQNSPPEEDLHISLIKGDDPRQGKLWCKNISIIAVETNMLSIPLACATSNDYLSGNIEIKNAQQGDAELNKELGLKGCPPQKKKDGDKNYACLGGGAVVDGKFDKNGKPPENPTRTGEDDGGEGDGGKDDSAESNCSQALSPFGWVLCPATNFADNLYSFFKNLVNNLLFFESDKYQDNGLYDSWKVMVTLANAVLVLVAIVMIAAQIFNFEFISAYTVKKALPRIVIAAILIQLSWFMVTAGIQIVNAIGSGIYWLLVAPFVSQLGGVGNNDGILEIGPILAQGYSGTNVGNTVANAVVFHYVLAATVGLAAGLAYSGLWISVVIAAIGVVISLLVAIVTLVIREVLLIVLIAIAPIAIAFWILPGTNNLWNMWWKTFSKLLLMYPLIMLLFAGGTIAAILLASAGGGINILFAVIAFFAPMFMIGATYKFAGGAFASIANMVNKVGSSARGGVDKGFNPLRERIKANKQAVKDYQKTEAFKDLNEGVGGIRGMRAKWRTGTLGYGVRKDTIEAYKKRAEKARLQGLIASREDEGLQTKYLDTEADNLKSLWSAGSSVFEEDVKFNGKTFDKGTTIELNDKDQMAALAVTGDLAQRRAALKQLNALQADAQMRAVTTEYVTNGQSMPDGAVEQFSKIQSTEFFPAYKANAPDLAKGGAEAGFKEFRSQEMRTWSADTIKQATEHIQRLRMSSEASDNARALVLQNQFDAAIHEIANDPSNPAGSLSPEARIATRVAYDTGVISGSAKDRFNPDGTFNTNPKEKGYQP